MGRFCFLRARVMAVAEVEASEVPLGVAYFRPGDRKQYLRLGTHVREHREGCRSRGGLWGVGKEEIHNW